MFQSILISNNIKTVSSSSNGYIHSSVITYETESTLLIASYTREDYNIFLTTLESINSIYFDVFLGILDIILTPTKSKNDIFKEVNLALVWRNYTNTTFNILECSTSFQFCISELSFCIRHLLIMLL